MSRVQGITIHGGYIYIFFSLLHQITMNITAHYVWFAPSCSYTCVTSPADLKWRSAKDEITDAACWRPLCAQVIPSARFGIIWVCFSFRSPARFEITYSLKNSVWFRLFLSNKKKKKTSDVSVLVRRGNKTMKGERIKWKTQWVQVKSNNPDNEKHTLNPILRSAKGVGCKTDACMFV